MKKIYHLPLAEISFLSESDVITTSGEINLAFSDATDGADVNSYKLSDLF